MENNVNLDEINCSKCNLLLWVKNSDDDSVVFSRENCYIEKIDVSTYSDEEVSTNIHVTCRKCKHVGTLTITAASAYGAVGYYFD